jgi:hypothetical protein
MFQLNLSIKLVIKLLNYQLKLQKSNLRSYPERHRWTPTPNENRGGFSEEVVFQLKPEGNWDYLVNE